MLSSSTLSPVSHAAASANWPAHGVGVCVCTSLVSFTGTTVSVTLGIDEGGSTSTTRTTAVPSSTRRTFSASHAGARAFCAEEEDGGEDPEKACQNALPRRWTSVCEAIVASAACCGVGICVPGCGEAGGVGYADVDADVKADGAWGSCLPLRREDKDGAAAAARLACVDEK